MTFDFFNFFEIFTGSNSIRFYFAANPTDPPDFLFVFLSGRQMFSDPEEYEKWKARGWRARVPRRCPDGMSPDGMSPDGKGESKVDKHRKVKLEAKEF